MACKKTRDRKGVILGKRSADCTELSSYHVPREEEHVPVGNWPENGEKLQTLSTQNLPVGFFERHDLERSNRVQLLPSGVVVRSKKRSKIETLATWTDTFFKRT